MFSPCGSASAQLPAHAWYPEGYGNRLGMVRVSPVGHVDIDSFPEGWSAVLPSVTGMVDGVKPSPSGALLMIGAEEIPSGFVLKVQ